MQAKVGDEIVVDAALVGGPQRNAEILEVLDVGGVVHYRVRWDDGHEAVFFPGTDAHVIKPGRVRR